MFYRLLDAQPRADCMSDGNLSSRGRGRSSTGRASQPDTHTAARRRQQFIGERLILPVSCMLFHSAEVPLKLPSFETIQDGHANIENDEVRIENFCLLDRLLTIPGFATSVPSLLRFE
jgi:hypothetical protein